MPNPGSRWLDIGARYRCPISVPISSAPELTESSWPQYILLRRPISTADNAARFPGADLPGAVLDSRTSWTPGPPWTPGQIAPLGLRHIPARFIGRARGWRLPGRCRRGRLRTTVSSMSTVHHFATSPPARFPVDFQNHCLLLARQSITRHVRGTAGNDPHELERDAGRDRARPSPPRLASHHRAAQSRTASAGSSLPLCQ